MKLGTDTAFDPPNTPNDFPVDSGLHDSFVTLVMLGGGLILFILLSLASIGIYIMAYKAALRNLQSGLKVQIGYLKDLVNQAALGQGGDQVSVGTDLNETYQSYFKGIDELNRKLDAHLKSLRKANSGQVEEAAPPKPHAGPIGNNSGTVINIAVNASGGGSGGVVSPEASGAAVAAPMAAAAVNGIPLMAEPPKPEAPAPIARQKVWQALRKLADLWKSQDLVLGAFHNAQQQLFHAQPWHAPDYPPASPRPRSPH